MSCPHCDRLRISVDMQAEEIRRLKRELGIRRKSGEIGAVMVAFGVTAVPARILLDLYAAKGRAVTHQALGAHMDPDSLLKTLDTHIHRIRKAMGHEAIETLKEHGYRLTAPGMSRMLAALEPPEMQDAREA